MAHREPARQAYRVWVGWYDHWSPRHAGDAPPRLVAAGPAEADLMSARQARRYVAVFNRTALALRRQVWAVAVPVVVRYDGEPRPGELLDGTARRSPATTRRCGKARPATRPC